MFGERRNHFGVGLESTTPGTIGAIDDVISHTTECVQREGGTTLWSGQEDACQMERACVLTHDALAYLRITITHRGTAGQG